MYVHARHICLSLGPLVAAVISVRRMTVASKPVHAKGFLPTRTRTRRMTRLWRIPLDSDLGMIFTFSPILAPQLESHVCRADEDLDVELGPIVFGAKVVPMSILSFHIGWIQH